MYPYIVPHCTAHENAKTLFIEKQANTLNTGWVHNHWVPIKAQQWSWSVLLLCAPGSHTEVCVRTMASEGQVAIQKYRPHYGHAASQGWRDNMVGWTLALHTSHLYLISSILHGALNLSWSDPWVPSQDSALSTTVWRPKTKTKKKKTCFPQDTVTGLAPVWGWGWVACASDSWASRTHWDSLPGSSWGVQTHDFPVKHLWLPLNIQEHLPASVHCHLNCHWRSLPPDGSQV